jgi:hypothetical protein
MKKAYYSLLLLLLACNHIETDSTLGASDIEYLRKLNLLSHDETVYKFYSNYKKRLSGSFFTNKRMASYWFDEFHEERTKVSFAYYTDIAAIDTVYFAGSTYTPYMLVTASDSSQFKVYVDGKRHEVKAFFEDAINLWKSKKRAAGK